MKRRGLLLDRDGVINIDHGYVGRRNNFEFMSGIFDFLNAAQDMNFRLAIITNQAGVARGYYTAEDYRDLEAWILNEFVRKGVKIDLVMACFEHKEGSVKVYKRESFWRKPNPGMILDAAQQLQLDLRKSIFIGDKILDMQAAEAAGIATRLMLDAKAAEAPSGASLIRNFGEALEVLRAKA